MRSFQDEPEIFLGIKTDKIPGGKAAEGEGESEDLPRQITLFLVDKEMV